jgi:hypothetical protein
MMCAHARQLTDPAAQIGRRQDVALGSTPTYSAHQVAAYFSSLWAGKHQSGHRFVNPVSEV